MRERSRIARWPCGRYFRFWRLGRGERERAIARSTGHSQRTIRLYDAGAGELGWTAGTSEPTEEVAAAIARRVHPAGHRDAGEVEALLLAHAGEIRGWLTPAPQEKRGLRRTGSAFVLLNSSCLAS
jgi:hypothetical protein